MKNITLSIDEKVLTAARRIAAANGTTVNALVRESLEDYATRGERAEEAWKALFELTDEEGSEIGELTWSRADLYVR